MADCKNCGATSQFQIKPLPGVPQGRFVTPLVRINGKVMDLPPGMTIPPQALDIAAIAAAVQELNDGGNGEGGGEPVP